MLTVPCDSGLGAITPNLLSGRLVFYAAVSIPYFYSAHPQRALPFKEGRLIFSAMFINSKVVF